MSTFRVRDFYTQMGLTMDLAAKFPFLDGLIKEPYRKATIQHATRLVGRDICEHILVNYI